MIGRSFRPMFFVRSGEPSTSRHGCGPEQPIRTEIHRRRIVRRENERSVPVEPEVRACRRLSAHVTVRIASATPNCAAAPPAQDLRSQSRLVAAPTWRLSPRGRMLPVRRAAGRRGLSRRPATPNRESSSPSDRSRCRIRRRRRRGTSPSSGCRSALRVALGPHQLPLSCKPAAHAVRPPHVGADRIELADGTVFTYSHVSAWSYVTSRPPSLPSSMCLLFLGSIQIA